MGWRLDGRRCFLIFPENFCELTRMTLALLLPRFCRHPQGFCHRLKLRSKYTLTPLCVRRLTTMRMRRGSGDARPTCFLTLWGVCLLIIQSTGHRDQGSLTLNPHWGILGRQSIAESHPPHPTLPPPCAQPRSIFFSFQAPYRSQHGQSSFKS